MSIFENKKIRLTVKSPIHIGSVEQKITRFEFIHQGQYIYPVSEDRLSVFLQKKNLISSYVTAVEREGNRFSLADLFKNKGVSLKVEDLEALSHNRKIKPLSDASQMQDFKPVIRDGFGIPYIPGTSIKGVIRTALLYNMLKAFKDTNPAGFKTTVENRIIKDVANKVNKKWLSQWANEKWLEGFVLEGKSKSPNTDWLRMLHISDAYSSNNIETLLIPANILKKENIWAYKKENSGQNTAIWVECIPENTAFEFEAAWDKKLLEDFERHNTNILLPSNLGGIFDNVNKWSQDVFDFEKQFSKEHALDKWYKNNQSSFRIGFGSGMIATTIAMLLDENLRKKVRNYAGLNRGNDIAPKSRRIWLKNNNAVPFGWAVIEVLPFDIKNIYTSTSASPVINSKEQETKIVDTKIVTKESKTNELIPETITWENATLTWSPGNQTLRASKDNLKAEIKISDRNFVPANYHEILFEKRKSFTANITVEKIGNAFKIIKIT